MESHSIPWVLLLVFVGGVLFILWLIALIRIIKNEFPGQNEKLIWALFVIFMPFIGMIVYFIVGRPREIKNKNGIS